MCKSAAIRVWDYDAGNSLDRFVAFSEQKLAELQERWGDPQGISGAAPCCLALLEAERVLLRESIDDVEIPF